MKLKEALEIIFDLAAESLLNQGWDSSSKEEAERQREAFDKAEAFIRSNDYFVEVDEEEDE